jgi:hypothetical protein
MQKMKYLKHTLLLLIMLAVQLAAMAQATKSKIVLKNGDVITGQILELKPNEYVKIEALGNVLTVQYSDIKTLYLNENDYVAEGNSTVAVPKAAKQEKPLGKFYFESHSEGAIGIGIGKVYNLPFAMGTTVLNDDVYGGIYTANGVGYAGKFFVGIGLGAYGHSGDQSYSLPYTLDVRYRVFSQKKFSPMAMAYAGAEYLEGGLGTFTFCDGVGLSIKLKEHFGIHVLVAHTFVRFMPNLSLENGFIEEALGNSYFNYFGLRAGVSFKL